MVREPAAFPADSDGKGGDLRPPFGLVTQRVQYVIVGQGEVRLGLQLTVHLVGQPQPQSYERQPRSLLVGRQLAERRLFSLFVFVRHLSGSRLFTPVAAHLDRRNSVSPLENEPWYTHYV